jgi:hypothetical protein
MGHFTTTFTTPSGTWKVALLKAAYQAACLHLGEVPRTPDADYARKIIRSGSFGLAGNSVGVDEPVPFRIFRIYGASAEAARRLWRERRGCHGQEAVFRPSASDWDRSRSSLGQFQICDNDPWISRFDDEPSLSLRQRLWGGIYADVRENCTCSRQLDRRLHVFGMRQPSTVSVAPRSMTFCGS